MRSRYRRVTAGGDDLVERVIAGDDQRRDANTRAIGCEVDGLLECRPAPPCATESSAPR